MLVLGIYVHSFQDRGKRFRLQQFICKHASKLFTRSPKSREDTRRPEPENTGYYPVLPSFEWFLNVDKEMRLQRFFEVRILSQYLFPIVITKLIIIILSPSMFRRVTLLLQQLSVKLQLDLFLKFYMENAMKLDVFLMLELK